MKKSAQENPRMIPPELARVRSTVKAVLFALAVQRYGREAWRWGLWRLPNGHLVIRP